VRSELAYNPNVRVQAYLLPSAVVDAVTVATLVSDTRAVGDFLKVDFQQIGAHEVPHEPSAHVPPLGQVFVPRPPGTDATWRR
jgi:hypothetical protein